MQMHQSIQILNNNYYDDAFFINKAELKKKINYAQIRHDHNIIYIEWAWTSIQTKKKDHEQ